MLNKNLYTKIASYEGQVSQIKKVVLLYSGGLDTSCMLKWIQDNYRAQVVTLTLDLGQQGGNLPATKTKAEKLGAVKSYIIDAKEEFANDYLAPLIKANGSYQGNYYISTVSRYLMAKWAVAIAYKEEADAVAHGCTGKGNDQVRIDGAVLILDPAMKIIAPVREWNLTREEEIAYAQKYDIPVSARPDFPYSDDDNMWGMTWEGGEIEDPQNIPQINKFLTACRPVEKTPDKAELITLNFRKGLPVALNDKTMTLANLIMALNLIAGKHGVGVVHHLEDRVVGLKNRGVYEHPAAHTIVEAHRNLEKYVCTRLENELKAMLDVRWGYLCYGAQWFDPVTADINAFNDKINERVNGEVTVKLFKGQATIVAMKSPFGLHHASFSKGETTYDPRLSAPFIEVYSFQARSAAQRAEKTALLSIGKLAHKRKLLFSVKKLARLGYQLFATDKTHAYLMENEVPSLLIHKISHKKETPNLRDVLAQRGFDLIINIPTGNGERQELTDGNIIRKHAVETGTPIYTQPDIAAHAVDKLYRVRFGNV